MKERRTNLNELSFDELISVRNSVGTKQFNSIYKAGKEIESNSEKTKVKQETQETKKRDKNKPQEVTSKRPVSRKRAVVETKKIKPRDPRFESLSGKFNSELFDRSYGFVKEIQESEAELLKKEIEREKDSSRKEELKKTFDSLTSRINARKLKETRNKIKRDVRKQEEILVQQGKKPYFVKKSVLKKVELKQKFQTLKGEKLEKFMERKRKKNAAKEHRMIPRTRRE